MCVLASILVLALFTLLFSNAIEKQRNPNSSPESVATGDGETSIMLHRNRVGHYVLTGQLNGQSTEFLVDTGATAVSVSNAIAQRAGLQRGHSIRALTANGMTLAYMTTIDRLVIGGIEERNVAASIVPNFPGEQVLLGMSFLKRLDFAQRGDTLILTQRSAPTAVQKR
jgi:aspartyl protease family protein